MPHYYDRESAAEIWAAISTLTPLAARRFAVECATRALAYAEGDVREEDEGDLAVLRASLDVAQRWVEGQASEEDASRARRRASYHEPRSRWERWDRLWRDDEPGGVRYSAAALVACFKPDPHLAAMGAAMAVREVASRTYGTRLPYGEAWLEEHERQIAALAA